MFALSEKSDNIIKQPKSATKGPGNNTKQILLFEYICI